MTLLAVTFLFRLVSRKTIEIPYVNFRETHPSKRRGPQLATEFSGVSDVTESELRGFRRPGALSPSTNLRSRSTRDTERFQKDGAETGEATQAVSGPLVSTASPWSTVGGLMSYSASWRSEWRPGCIALWRCTEAQKQLQPLVDAREFPSTAAVRRCVGCGACRSIGDGRRGRRMFS